MPADHPNADTDVDEAERILQQLRRAASALLTWSPRSTGALRLQDALAGQEHRFDDCAEALIGTDLTGVVAYWNGEAERLYGWSAAEAIGRPIEQLVVARRDEQLSRRIMRSICWTGHWEGDFWVLRRDGSTFCACVVHAVVEDDDGVPLGIFGVSRDTERPPRT
ncbi:MAG: two-component system, sensor histidine kinase and response regulator [Solirubrobacteraceae bacterium]|nr:two-component system, sensor histidine kinase and response regulator [Solirubrobacteraceae bacterium]